MKKRAAQQQLIREILRILYGRWGRQHWWPAETPFEVIVGAYLTQNTAWTNVEKALQQMRSAGVLSVEGIRKIPLTRLEKLVRSAGYFRQKATRLKQFVAFLDERYQGSLQKMFAQPTAELREELLALNGIGPETADSILLYAGQHPVFVVDSYTRRIFERHGLVKPSAKYEELRELVETGLADFALSHPDIIDPELLPLGSCHQPSPMSTASRCAQAQVFNEMHGLLVGVGKNYCLKSNPKCNECPLGSLLKK
ncbi:MAG TPA: hypothetical protein VKW78_01165 [Terriglobales bacterium]|nr:hypothetical protein [Terriglobales bacterium]